LPENDKLDQLIQLYRSTMGTRERDYIGQGETVLETTDSSGGIFCEVNNYANGEKIAALIAACIDFVEKESRKRA
jgi:hypothetical protein